MTASNHVKKQEPLVLMHFSGHVSTLRDQTSVKPKAVNISRPILFEVEL